LDSLSTSLNFLKNSQYINNPKLNATLEKYTSVQDKLNQTESIRRFIIERQQILKEQLQKLGMLKELKGFQKEVFYYRAQLQEYRELWTNPSKIEAKLLEAVQTLPQFKEFFASNSLIGRLFPMPSGPAGASVALAGLQTRAMVNQALADRFGSGADVTQMLQQNLQGAQDQLQALKDKAEKIGTGSLGSSEDFDLPTGFRPDGQRTKTFFRRLEYGANIQTGKSSTYFPVTSDL
jgi:hypothetical protein